MTSGSPSEFMLLPISRSGGRLLGEAGYPPSVSFWRLLDVRLQNKGKTPLTGLSKSEMIGPLLSNLMYPPPSTPLWQAIITQTPLGAMLRRTDFTSAPIRLLSGHPMPQDGPHGPSQFHHIFFYYGPSPRASMGLQPIQSNPSRINYSHTQMSGL